MRLVAGSRWGKTVTQLRGITALGGRYAPLVLVHEQCAFQ